MTWAGFSALLGKVCVPRFGAGGLLVLGPAGGRRMPSPVGTSTGCPFVLDCECLHLESALFLLLKVKMRENQVCGAE